MQLVLLTGDPLFRTAVTGLAGALGHEVASGELAGADVTICDAGTVDFAALAGQLDPLRTLVFLPSGAARMPPAAMLSAFPHVAARTALAAELPRLLALLG
ncbi:MAG: hypothetical protein C0506_00775 [Anaerolinea sp.]|nr:hypothetical protein [Anaerolinea sp.]